MMAEWSPATLPAQRTLLVVWWSNTGATRQLVEAMQAAATRAEPGLRVCAQPADLVRPEALLEATALVFATPECLGSMAGEMKAFFDRCYYPVLGCIEGRPYATLVCAGTDGQGATRQLDRIATGWRLRRIAEPLIVITGAQTPTQILAPKTADAAALDRARELGASIAAGTALGIW